MVRVAVGKSEVKTRGVHAPAVMIRRVQGMSVSVPVVEERMRTLERSPCRSCDAEITLAGWWIWTPRVRHCSSRNCDRRKGSLAA